MHTKKRIGIIRIAVMVIFLLTFLALAGGVLHAEGQLESSNPEKADTVKTEELMADASRQVSFPAIRNWTEKRLVKYLYELRDRQDLILYAYNYSVYTGMYTFVGKCVGYGIPYSTQYSNPVKIKDDPNGTMDAGSVLIPQPEPNGLYIPEGLDATWIMMIDPETGEPGAIYMEPDLTVSPFPLRKEVCLNGINQ